MTLPRVDLGASDKPIAMAVVRTPQQKRDKAPGREVGVRAIDGESYREMMQFNAATMAGTIEERVAAMEGLDPTRLWAIAAKLMPDATDEEIGALSAVECGAVLRIASGRVDALLAELAALEKKETAPEAPGGNLGHAPTTPSPLSAPASPGGSA